MKKTWTDHQQNVYNKLNLELDALIDENSMFLFNCNNHRILVDKDHALPTGCFRVRIRGNYAETEYKEYNRDPNKKRYRSIGRFILGLNDSDLTCDHININTLDNRRVNLRPLTRSENSKNKRRFINNPQQVKTGTVEEAASEAAAKFWADKSDNESLPGSCLTNGDVYVMAFQAGYNYAQSKPELPNDESIWQWLCKRIPHLEGNGSYKFWIKQAFEMWSDRKPEPMGE